MRKEEIRDQKNRKEQKRDKRISIEKKRKDEKKREENRREEKKRDKRTRVEKKRQTDRQTHTHTSKKDLTSVFYERNNILNFIFNLFKYSNCQN